MFTVEQNGVFPLMSKAKSLVPVPFAVNAAKGRPTAPKGDSNTPLS